LFDSIQGTLLEGPALFLRVAAQAQIKRHHRDLLRLKTEPHLERLLKSPQRDQAGGNKHEAQGDLQDHQHVSKGQPPTRPARHGAFQNPVGVRL